MALRFVMLNLEVSVTGMILTYFRVEFLIVGAGSVIGFIGKFFAAKSTCLN